jgi:hypothetical protein
MSLPSVRSVAYEVDRSPEGGWEVLKIERRAVSTPFDNYWVAQELAEQFSADLFRTPQDDSSGDGQS